MLVDFKPLNVDTKELPVDNKKQPEAINVSGSSIYFTSETGLITKFIGEIVRGQDKHFWSHGNFNMMRLIFWVLEQTGPAEILLSTYSISPKTIQGIINRREKGIIRDIRFIVDNRVRSISPKPFDLMVSNFDYRCISIHAKVACIWNEEWKITIVSSQNATDNPKMERGVIYTNEKVFEFDKEVLEDAFKRGTT
jgi:hypothetical protein